jgi:hypothetical protein
VPLTAAVALLASACAAHQAPSTHPETATPGYRLLYQAEAVTPEGKTHFRMAAAVRPPDHLRLELFGPMGGARLLLATDGSDALALLPRQRLYDRARASPRALARLTGLKFEPAGLVGLLRGQAPCAAAEQVFEPADQEGVEGVTLRCRLDDAVVAVRVAGGSWATSIRIGLESVRKSVRLDLVEGPTASSLADDLFAPAIPEGFTRGNLLGDGPPLLIVDEPGGAEGEHP